jgi:hypothetical protein
VKIIEYSYDCLLLVNTRDHESYRKFLPGDLVKFNLDKVSAYTIKHARVAVGLVVGVRDAMSYDCTFTTVAWFNIK